MNILVLGYFGFRTNQLDGQTVKTRDVYQLLLNKVGKEHNVDYFDTQDFQYTKISLFRMLKKIVISNKVIYLPAHNNLKYIFPFVYLLSKIFRLRILYLVIGGWLSEYISKLPVHQYMLKRIEGIFTETSLLKGELESKYKFNNVHQLCNFRFVNVSPILHHKAGMLKLVFMARINKMKGLDTIFSLAEYVKQTKIDVRIDFYGPILEEDKDYFYSNLEKYDNSVYKGVLEPHCIHQVLQQYDAMLLPTHYYTEGLPGSVVDAYMSGLPVVVSNWKHATEFVDNESTGFIVPFENGEKELFQSVEKFYYDEQLLEKMKKNALVKAKMFTADYAWSILNKYICI